jgi:glutamate dehydrogenase (NAD(P)+)
VLGKDLGASDLLLDTLYRHAGSPQLAAAQAQQPDAPLPDQLRQLTGYRRHMTGLGLAFSVSETLGDSLIGCRVLVQGFGAVGAGSAAQLSAQGATIVGVSDVQGSILNPLGLPLNDLLAASDAAGVLDPTRLGHLGTRGPTEALFGCEADLLVLAAASHSVDGQLAGQIQVPLVAEGANFGLTEDARAVLHQRDVVVLPDIIANSAAAAMACRQIGSGNRLDRQSLWTAIEESIRTSTRTAMGIAEARRCTLREAWTDKLEGQTT